METSLCVKVCVIVEGMYTCNNGNFDNEPLCLYLCCCRGYVLGSWLGSVVGLVIGCNEGNGLSLWYGKVLSRTDGDLVEL